MQEQAPVDRNLLLFCANNEVFYCARIVNNCALSSGSLLMGLRKGRISKRDYGSGADSRPGTLGGERKNEEK